ncbi:Pantoate--beta-alanine ligase [Labilithrix luteola]|uniref:Pantothenate synthetase n=1 Tax=Labilithrix luteola TaxID=1391654 RepID=A0A0K1Q5C8_9BACT|nr:Pantoate--beta-alanine ligase [Labilithrix luteola]
MDPKKARRAVVVTTPAEARAACDEARKRGLRVGLVPTMGALHEGHLALTRLARQKADFVVCSIFVNPTQFGPNEDFDRYPRDLEGDVTKLTEVDLVFAPSVQAMYPPGDETRVRVGALAEHLCGPHRPGHFEGVATVVTKLFGVVGPCTAVFGKKDYQQLAVLRRVVTDLFLPVDVVGHPILREPDGLAMSSRNAYLSPEERAKALSLSHGLAAAARAFEAGERRAGTLRELAYAPVAAVATSIDYVTVADADALVPFADGASVGARATLAIACRVGKTRLIDNVVLGEDLASSIIPAF